MKAVLMVLKQPSASTCSHRQKSLRETAYYAKHTIMIVMIMVMNVHNLFPLSVKTILPVTGRNSCLMRHSWISDATLGKCFMKHETFSGQNQILYFGGQSETFL